MSERANIHVIPRQDGVWQVSREDAVLALSLHEDRDAAIDSALAVAKREHRGLTIHRVPRPLASELDRLVWAVRRRILSGPPRRKRVAS